MAGKRNAPAKSETGSRHDRREVIYIPVEDLVVYGNNARTHSDAQIEEIKNSILEYGFTNPLLIDDDGIIAGHGRLAGVLRLPDRIRNKHYKELPCIHVGGLSPASRRALILADNKIALNAGWDMNLLSVELGEIETLGGDLSLTGFSDEELTVLMPEEEVEPVGGGGEPPEIPFERRFKFFEPQRETVEKALDRCHKVMPLDSDCDNPDGTRLALICDWFLKHEGLRPKK